MSIWPITPGWRRGLVVTNGPLADQPDESLRGLTFYRTGSLADARRLAEADPAVEAGRLAVEHHDLVLPGGHHARAWPARFFAVAWPACFVAVAWPAVTSGSAWSQPGIVGL